MDITSATRGEKRRDRLMSSYPLATHFELSASAYRTESARVRRHRQVSTPAGAGVTEALGRERPPASRSPRAAQPRYRGGGPREPSRRGGRALPSRPPGGVLR